MKLINQSIETTCNINYIVTTQGFNGKKITECETKKEALEALTDCSIGALTNISSTTNKDISEFIPY